MIRLGRVLPRSILARSLLIVLTPIVILQIVVALVFYERHWETVTRRLTDAVAGDISTLIWMMNSYAGEDGRSLALRIGRMHLKLEAHLRPDETLPDPLPPAGNSRVERLLAVALEYRVGRNFEIDTDVDNRMVLIRVALREGVLDVLVNEKRLTSTTTDIFVYWMVGTSALLALIAAYFVNQQIRPIRRLARAAEAFGEGGTDVVLKPSGAREVRQAATAFLRMRERILRQIERHTRMLAGVSHDLRTPLTRMRLQLAMAGDDGMETNLKADIEEMEHMIDAYLAFARGAGEEQPQDVDLTPLLAEVAGNAAQPVSLRAPEALTIKVRRNALKRCLTNLVDNACRYGGAVRLEASREDGRVVVTVDDDGPGIPAHERGEAQRPFVRLGNHGGAAGSGLGLTVARDIVRGHGGDLSLDSSPVGGLRARITLPA